MSQLSLTLVTVVLLFSAKEMVQVASDVVGSDQIYSLDRTEGNQTLSITIGEDGATSSEVYDNSDPKQRFIGRENDDGTFVLFSELQPWNWVDHIVENSHTIRIDIKPKCLDSALVNGSRILVEEDYSNSVYQHFYTNPVNPGDPESLVLIVNMQTRQCIEANSLGEPVLLNYCDMSKENQQFKMTIRTSDRCY